MTKEERQRNYRELFKGHVSVEFLKNIRESINKGLALGDQRFVSQIEALTKRRNIALTPNITKIS
jgi:putative transposase